MGVLQFLNLTKVQHRQASATLQQLADFGAERSGGMPLVACFVSDPTWAPILANWHTQVENAGVTSALIITLQGNHAPNRTLRSVRELTPNHTPSLWRATFPEELPSFYEQSNRSIGIQRVWVQRWVAIWTLLQHGLEVLNSDADAVFLRNPLPLLRGVRADIIASHGQSNADWLACMGWLMLRPTPGLRRFVQRLISVLVRTDAGDDQIDFNTMLMYETGMRWPFNMWHCTNAAMVDVSCDLAPKNERNLSRNRSFAKRLPALRSPADAWCRRMLYANAVDCDRRIVPDCPSSSSWNLTVAVLPQWIVRRHGCYQAHAPCYRHSAVTRRQLTGEEVRNQVGVPKAEQTAVLHCRALDIEWELHQKTPIAAKAMAMARLGIWGLPHDAISAIANRSSKTFEMTRTAICDLNKVASERDNCKHITRHLTTAAKPDGQRFLAALRTVGITVRAEGQGHLRGFSSHQRSIIKRSDHGRSRTGKHRATHSAPAAHGMARNITRSDHGLPRSDNHRANHSATAAHDMGHNISRPDHGLPRSDNHRANHSATAAHDMTHNITRSGHGRSRKRARSTAAQGRAQRRAAAGGSPPSNSLRPGDRVSSVAREKAPGGWSSRQGATSARQAVTARPRSGLAEG